MFGVDSRLHHLAAQRSDVIAIYASLNQPHIGVPGKTAQEAQAFIISTRNASGHFSIFVTLHLTKTHELVHYTDSDQPEVPKEGYRDAEADAVGFVESMGFMLDNLNYRSLPPDQQDNLIATLPPFLAKPGASARAAETPGDDEASPQVKLAKLFASF
jgi:hypothetical protein